MKFLILLLSFFIYSQAHAEVSNQSKHGLRVYDSLIAPVFEARCLHCHGENKDKGKLRMDKKEFLLKGGRSAGKEIIVKSKVENTLKNLILFLKVIKFITSPLCNIV